jgi:hypothetical protein
MSLLIYKDVINGTDSIAHISSLIYAPDFRFSPKNQLVPIQLANGRFGQATAEHLRDAFAMASKAVVTAAPGHVIHLMNDEGKLDQRSVTAWTITTDKWGDGINSHPVPESLFPEDSFGFGSAFVCVERPDGTCFTESSQFSSFDTWRRYATAELKRWRDDSKSK